MTSSVCGMRQAATLARMATATTEMLSQSIRVQPETAGTRTERRELTAIAKTTATAPALAGATTDDAPATAQSVCGVRKPVPLEQMATATTAAVAATATYDDDASAAAVSPAAASVRRAANSTPLRTRALALSTAALDTTVADVADRCRRGRLPRPSCGRRNPPTEEVDPTVRATDL